MIGQKKVSQTQLLSLVVPRSVLVATFTHFLPYWRAGVETACYWYGIETGELQVVTTLGIPQLYQSGGHYKVEKESVFRLADQLEKQGLTNLAQIHTHPPRCSVGHSYYDDQHAYSTREGSLSLVWPEYGLRLTQDLSGIGIHERQDGNWVRLTGQQITKRIRLVDDVIDARWGITAGQSYGETEWESEEKNA